MNRLKKNQSFLEPTSSSPLPSLLSASSSSTHSSRSLSPSHYSSSDVSFTSSSSGSFKDSRPPSPVLSPKESTKLPFLSSKMDRDIKSYNHNLSISEDMFSDFSVENLRSGTPHLDELLRSKCTVDLKNNDLSQLSFKHVQYMLDDNQKLSDEVSALKAKLNVINADYVNLSCQYQQLESKCQTQNKELIELEGKVSALTVKLKAESEAKLEVQTKLALAESTIESLNRQIGELSKSDSTARIRENYEAMLNRIQQQHENEIILLKGENEGLRYELETRQAEINKLKADRNSDNLSSVSDLKRSYEKILQDTHDKKEYESMLKKKDEEIESLQREIIGLKSNTSNQSSAPSFSDNSCKCVKKTLSQSDSDYVAELKEEFEKCLVNLQTRRTQIASLQSQLTGVKKDNTELREKLKETEKKLSETNEFLSSAHEPWLKEVEARYEAQFERDLKEAIRVMDKTQREEMERSFNQRLEEYVNQLIDYIQSFSDTDYTERDQDQMHFIFAPLRKLWTAINCNLDDRLNELDQKQQSMLEAKENLERALILSRSLDTSVPQSSLIHQELEKIKEDGMHMKAKLHKYKKHIHRLVERHERKIEDLQNQYVKTITEKEREFKRREEQLIKELSNDPLAICRKLSRHVNSH
ncbi:A-kinase anchor protein 9 [Tetranychus urticae]|uniref:A-kinase anchor protein 9 n=1 Tax=Tetranychus urticae TaxID=32264 RepID=UPI00077BAE03|nr:A-kinase anchor protein 9 [Tetranychus urticae]